MTDATTDAPRASADTLDWVRYYWERQMTGSSEAFLAMASINRAHQIMSATIDRSLKPLGLTRTTYMFLMTVLLSDSGARRMMRISEHLLVHPTTVTLVADQLEKRGLLERSPHPTDRRVTLCKITPAGRALAEKATSILATEGYGMPGLTTSTWKKVVALLQKVRFAAGDVLPQGDFEQSDS